VLPTSLSPITTGARGGKGHSGGCTDRYGDQCRDQDALIAFCSSTNNTYSIKDFRIG